MPDVRTTAGIVRGLVLGTPDGEARAFLGVPYAVADRRFLAAGPVEPWSDVLDAQRSGPVAPQRADDGSLVGDEAGCLTVNIWSSAPTGSDRPVMVWIHGGLHVAGSNSSPLTDGARFAALTGTVVVAVGHRLGALGFLTLDHLLGDAYGDSANIALHDIVAALRWVRREIRAFGGDPERVTLAGQSAGATTVAMLLAARPAAGLFQRAVLHSASPERVADRRHGEGVTADLLELLGMSTDPDLLLDVPWAQIVEAQSALLARRSLGAASTVAAFRASVDGRMLDQTPVDAVRAGASDSVDLIVGTNVNEASGAVGLRAADSAELRTLLDRQLATLLPVWDGSIRGPRAVAYRDALRHDLGHAPTDAEALEAAVADDVYRQPTRRLLEARGSAAGSTRAFLFCWRAAEDDAGGAAHSLELPFLFRHLYDSPDAIAEVGGAPPPLLSDRMATRWGSFVASGDAGARWPTWAPQSRSTLVLAQNESLVDNPRGHVAALVSAATRQAWS
ncbi:carboxylesterase/lipase family protein [Clavibacter michiganensis subsp. phaseoli]|uniref:Carboxylic ester hydrolase n=1 Tax=Clavibacter phaseoli TaxID=1734031 RepID=A0A8I0S9V8_9MICO|nr:carboxylesterase family protein [Clavibacter phaseoli]MBF4631733.1 carboxylesterase/lipase family protein [Clavibacter phaseoli]